mmetsp:Transcript_24902/g.58006  ORF Transcript_24902/g.58006 Transcript_24902/m.58006 type:complete len:201 (-) Transcript_24902:691-1293(-)
MLLDSMVFVVDVASSSLSSTTRRYRLTSSFMPFVISMVSSSSSSLSNMDRTLCFCSVLASCLASHVLQSSSSCSFSFSLVLASRMACRVRLARSFACHCISVSIRPTVRPLVKDGLDSRSLRMKSRLTVRRRSRKASSQSSWVVCPHARGSFNTKRGTLASRQVLWRNFAAPGTRCNERPSATTAWGLWDAQEDPPDTPS